MRVDAARRMVHRRFRSDAKLLQAREGGSLRTRLRDCKEIAAQREQAAHERRRIHVAMAAGIERCNETGLRRADELGMQRRDGQSAELTGIGIESRARSQR